MKLPYKFKSVLFFIATLLNFHSYSQSLLEHKVDEYLSPLVESGDFYGTVLFAKNGYIDLVKGYGYSNLEQKTKNSVETIYHIASVNKPITAIGVMVLHQEGKLDIDDNLKKYINDYPRGDEITIQDLLAQTSGIPSYNGFEDYGIYAERENTLAEVVNWFKDKELLFEPGSKYDYSNCNYALLAYIIEIVSKQSYEDFMFHNVFKPLGMFHTAMYKYDDIVENRAVGYSPANNAYDLRPIGKYNNSIKVGSGALYSSVMDLFKLEQALYTDAILNGDTRKRMLTEVQDNDYGLGWGIWQRFNKNKFDHDGTSSGSVAYFSTYPDDKVTIIFLGNINTGVFHSMKKDLAAIYFGEKYEVPQKRKYITLEESKLSKFEGRYEFENGNFFDLKVIEGSLWFLWRGRGELGYLLSPLNENSFYMRARGDQIDFKIDENGVPQATYIERNAKSNLKKIK